jgi:hypothetical protein
MFSEFAEEIRHLSPTGPTERELQNFLLEDSGKVRANAGQTDSLSCFG